MKNFFTFIVLVAFAISGFNANASDEVVTTQSSTTAAQASSSSSTYGLDYQGEPPQELSMISSLGSLTAYALDMVKIGFKSVWTEDILYGSDAQTYYFIEGSDVGDVISKMSSKEFKFRVYDSPTNAVSATSFLASSSNDILFVGYSMTGNFTSLGNNSFRMNIPKITLRLYDYIPIAFPNAIEARIRYTDANGNEWSEFLPVQDGGKVLFPSKYAGRYSSPDGKSGAGTLIVRTYYPTGGPALSPGDSFETAYDLHTGTKKATYLLSGNLQSSVQNHVDVSDVGMSSNGPLVINMTAERPNGNFTCPPTARIKINKDGARRTMTMAIGIPGDIQRPDLIEAWVYNPASQDSSGTVLEYKCDVIVQKIVIGNTVISTTINVTKNLDGEATWSLYLVIPEFESSLIPEAPYYYGYGEKG